MLLERRMPRARRSHATSGRPWRGDGGSVVAEFAVALPAIVIVLALGIGALGATARGVRLQDAVSDAARLAARGESADRVHAVVAAAVDDATATIEHRDDIVCISARAPVAVLTLTATGCALAGGG